MIFLKQNISRRGKNNAVKESIYSYKAVTERQMELPIAAIRQMIEAKEVNMVKWIGTKDMYADILTKTGVNPINIREILEKGKLTHTRLNDLLSQSCGEKL